MMTVSEAILKMTAFLEGRQHDTDHFLKVWALARTIGQEEKLPERTLLTLELAAVVHDIACPKLRAERGSCPGDLQEAYGPPMVRSFFEGTGLDEEMLERICWLVGHHHTFSPVDGPDHRILLEADLLVNAGEKEQYRSRVPEFRGRVFRTKSGTALLDAMFPQ